jgi:hypothetical protein
MAAAKPDLKAAKEAKQKKMLIALSVVFVALMAWQVPKLLGGSEATPGKPKRPCMLPTWECREDKHSPVVCGVIAHIINREPYRDRRSGDRFGTTQRGRPFFAMECVQGSPITEFCGLGPARTLRSRVAVAMVSA